jgi:hypothetical protein
VGASALASVVVSVPVDQRGPIRDSRWLLPYAGIPSADGNNYRSAPRYQRRLLVQALTPFFSLMGNSFSCSGLPTVVAYSPL